MRAFLRVGVCVRGLVTGGAKDRTWATAAPTTSWAAMPSLLSSPAPPPPRPASLSRSPARSLRRSGPAPLAADPPPVPPPAPPPPAAWPAEGGNGAGAGRPALAGGVLAGGVGQAARGEAGGEGGRKRAGFRADDAAPCSRRPAERPGHYTLYKDNYLNFVPKETFWVLRMLE